MVTVGSRGRVVIPANVRRDLGIETGDQLNLTVDDNRLVLESRRAAARRLRGMFRHLATDVSVVDELIAERREEARREESD